MILLATDINNWFVCGLGVGTVFLGLVCIIVMCKIIGAFCNKAAKKPEKTPVAAPAMTAGTAIENKQELIAAISAAVAEELGTDVSAIRITSFKKL